MRSASRAARLSLILIDTLVLSLRSNWTVHVYLYCASVRQKRFALDRLRPGFVLAKLAVLLGCNFIDDLYSYLTGAFHAEQCVYVLCALYFHRAHCVVLDDQVIMQQ